MPEDDDGGPRKMDVETRKMQAALISAEIAKAISKLPEMDIEEMRDAIRRFIVTGPQQQPGVDVDQMDVKKILLSVLDMIEDRPWLYFMVRKKDEKPRMVKFRFEPKYSRYFVGLLRRVLAVDYGRYLAERDTIGLEAYSLEGRRKREEGHVTSLRDILRRGAK